MKQCINNQCKHELDDYQDRCPYCGWSQKCFKSVTPKNVGDLQDKVKLNEEPLRKRHGCVTTYIFILLGSSNKERRQKLLGKYGINRALFVSSDSKVTFSHSITLKVSQFKH